jgi:hypothetical protein
MNKNGLAHQNQDKFIQPIGSPVIIVTQIE